MQKKTVQVSYIFEIEYDENSDHFTSSLQAYREVMYPSAQPEDMIKSAIAMAHQRGANALLEGIGHVKMNGRCPDEDMYCGIDIDDDSPIPEVEFI